MGDIQKKTEDACGAMVAEVSEERVCEHSHEHVYCHEHVHSHEHSHEQRVIEQKEKCGQEAIERVYILNGLACANCGGKIEEAAGELAGVEKAELTFMTKKLRVWQNTECDLTEHLQNLCDQIEEGITVAREGVGEFRIFLIENLNCAHCAGKIEEAIRSMSEVEEAILSFELQQLKIKSKEKDLLEKIQQIADSIEDGVIFREAGTERAKRRELAIGGVSGLEKSEIAISLVLFCIAEWTSLIPDSYAIYAYVLAYLAAGWRILKAAIANLGKGQMLDENFLMAIATLGAFAIMAYEEAVGVILFYRIGEFFEEKAVAKSRGQIMDTIDMRPDEVHRVRGGKTEIVGIEDIRIGDILQIRPGERIPLDGLVVQGSSQIDTAPITGEPVPVQAAEGTALLSGAINIDGQLLLRVEKELAESTVTKVLDAVENAAANKPTIDRFIRRFAKVYTPLVVAIAVITAIVPSLITGEWYHWFYTAMTFLVISCPCALVLSVPLTFFSGIGAGSKQGILFKGGISLETLKRVKAVVMDKTGTLTKGDFSVQHITPAGHIAKEKLLEICASAEQASTHPIAKSIVAAAKQQGLLLSAAEQVQEIAGKGITALIQGDRISCGNVGLLAEQGIFVPEDTEPHAGAVVYIGINHQYAGKIQVSDTIKPDAKEAVNALHRMGIVTVMLTGDNEKAANAVGKELGVGEIHSQLLPHEKLTALQKSREEYGPVLFVGDGINDAPVLANADVGSAMGSGADAAIEAADIVFMNNSVQAIVKALHISYKTNQIAWQNIIFAIAVKVAIMAAGFLGYASMWAAVFADTGVAILCVLNAIRILYMKSDMA